MDHKREYNIVLVMQQLAGAAPSKIVQYYVMRTGNRESYLTLKSTYEELLRTAKEYGYEDPLSFLKDRYKDEVLDEVVTSDDNLDLNLLRSFLNVRYRQTRNNNFDRAPPSDWSTDATSSRTRTPVQEPEVSHSQNTKLNPPRPRKLQIGSLNSSTPNTEIMPERVKMRIIKNRKKSKIYKEMDVSEKEHENRFDSYLYSSMHSELTSDKLSEEEQTLENSPFSCEEFNDLDVEFKRIVHKVCVKDKTQAKDKSALVQDMALFKEYFEKKLNIKIEEDLAVKKMAQAIASLMKKLQDKIFVSDDKNRNLNGLLVAVKNKLYAYYNFIKK